MDLVSRLDLLQVIKGNVEIVLRSRSDGIFMDRMCEEYEFIINRPLPFLHLGFSTLESFLHSIPDTVRLEYSARDQRMKVYSAARPSTSNSYLGGTSVNHNSQKQFRFPASQRTRIDAQRTVTDRSVNHGRTLSVTSVFSQDDIAADHRGIYTVCFPSCQKPTELAGTLEDMFKLAGKVHEINETPKLIFVRYYDQQSVKCAFKLFSHMGLRTASDSDLHTPVSRTKGADKRKFDSSNLWGNSDQAHSTVPRKRIRGMITGRKHNICIGNLNPSVNYTIEMFRKLFQDYRIGWVKVKRQQREGQEPKLFAYAVSADRQEAEQLVNDFNGYVWFGRALHLQVKDKHGSQQKKGMAVSTNSMKMTPSSSIPDLEYSDVDWDDMPELESVDDTEDMPGLEPAMPGLEPAMPGLEPAMPGLEPAMPGLEPAMPGLEPAIPGLEPIPHNMKRALSDFGSFTARPEPVSPLQDLRVQRKFDSPKNLMPSVLVTNFRDDVDKPELLSLFEDYNAKSVTIVPTQSGKKKAFIELGSVADVIEAVRNLNRSFYKEMWLKVDVPFNMPELREAVQGNSAQQTSSGSMTFSEVLKMRGNCLQVLHSTEQKVNLGQQLNVLITTVISDKFFWGQIVDQTTQAELAYISKKLNEGVGGKMEKAYGRGRCKARFPGDGKWYRAWIMSDLQSNQCHVFYLDYGNTAQIPWDHTARINENWIWDLPPQAVPFILTEPVSSLEDRELTRITVEVNALGTLEEGNMLVVRATSLLPNLKAIISGTGRTIVM